MEHLGVPFHVDAAARPLGCAENVHLPNVQAHNRPTLLYSIQRVRNGAACAVMLESAFESLA